MKRILTTFLCFLFLLFPGCSRGPENSVDLLEYVHRVDSEDLLTTETGKTISFSIDQASRDGGLLFHFYPQDRVLTVVCLDAWTDAEGKAQTEGCYLVLDTQYGSVQELLKEDFWEGTVRGLGNWTERAHRRTESKLADFTMAAPEEVSEECYGIYRSEPGFTLYTKTSMRKAYFPLTHFDRIFYDNDLAYGSSSLLTNDCDLAMLDLSDP